MLLPTAGQPLIDKEPPLRCSEKEVVDLLTAILSRKHLDLSGGMNRAGMGVAIPCDCVRCLLSGNINPSRSTSLQDMSGTSLQAAARVRDDLRHTACLVQTCKQQLVCERICVTQHVWYKPARSSTCVRGLAPHSTLTLSTLPRIGRRHLWKHPCRLCSSCVLLYASPKNMHSLAMCAKSCVPHRGHALTRHVCKVMHATQGEKLH
eukprot:1158458-Pelagomonas_calceolata.AAC.12